MFQFPTWATEELIYKIMNFKVFSAFPDFQSFLNASGVSPTEEETNTFREALEQELVAHVDNMAAHKYYMMELSNDYGECGEQRVSISYCRKLLKIPHNRPVTQFDADIFRRKIEEQRDQLGIKGKSLENLKSDYLTKLLERLIELSLYTEEKLR